MNKKNILASIAMAVLTVSVVPGLASAHGSKDNNRDRDANRQVRFVSENELGIKIFNNQMGEDRGLHLGQSGLFYKGQVSSVLSNGFNATINGSANIFVDTSAAKLIRVPRTPIALANISVNDKVWITGTKSGSTVSASVVYVMSQNVKPAAAKGTVTANSNNTLTVQTKNNNTVTVKTDSDTQIVNNGGQTISAADIQVGSKVKLWGLWDEITKVFSAIKIKVK